MHKAFYKSRALSETGVPARADHINPSALREVVFRSWVGDKSLALGLRLSFGMGAMKLYFHKFLAVL